MNESDLGKTDLYSGCLAYELNGVPCEINFDAVDIETIEETYGNVVRDRVLRFEVIMIGEKSELPSDVGKSELGRIVGDGVKIGACGLGKQILKDWNKLNGGL